MIIPAIDLMNGGCVRLLKGDFDARTDYPTDPVDMARSFANEGAEWLHVVDLDGARNERAEQPDLIIQIARESGLKTQTGGGLRTLSQIQTLLENGVKRVVIGSMAVRDPDQVRCWMSTIGPEKIVLALDIAIDADGMPRLAIHGWLETSERSLWDVMDDYLGAGLKNILVTDIARDGVLKGANIGLYQDIQARYPDLDLITSGGVGSLDDVHALKALSPAGIIIGKALYENRFTLKEALKC